MIDLCPSCLRAAGSVYNTPLFNGVCYFCWKTETKPTPQPIITPCPRRPAPQEALR